MSGLLSTICYIADLNAAEVKARHLSRTGARALTVAEAEELEWQAFRAKLDRQRSRLGAEVGDEDEVDEDDADSLILLLGVLDASPQPLTIFEVMRGLQTAGVLSLEFPAAARGQALRLLARLRTANRAFADAHGRWGLLR